MDPDSGNMKFNRKGEVCYLTFPSFEKYPFVRHAFSTRLGGVSRDRFSSMNLGLSCGDKRENVLRNYRLFCAAAGFDYATLVSSSQDHHTFIRRVGRKNLGTGVFRPRDMDSVDGLITDEPGVTLVTHYADCVPLFLLDAKKKAVGLVHAGWRGTAAKIGAAAVAAMRREFGTDPKDLVAGIGPSIGPCCFEVDAPVRDEFAKLEELRPAEWIREDGGGKYHIDLWEANRRILTQAGVPQSGITVSGVCTDCNAGWLFSHRATGGRRGSLAAFMALREPGGGHAD